MTKMTPKERAHYDAQADHEAWCFAGEILAPWVKVAKLIGSDELTLLMEEALGKAEAEVDRGVDVLKALREEENAS